MLGDFEPKRGSRTRSFLTAILVVKALRAASLNGGWQLLNSFPLFTYTFYVSLFSSLLLLVIQRPWKGKKAILSKGIDQWVRLVIYSSFVLLSLIFYNLGLKYYGPTRTLLSSEFGDFIFVFIISSLFSKTKSPQSEKIQGAFVLLVAYTLLFWIEPSISAPVVSNNGDGLTVQLPLEDFQFAFLSIPQTKMGGICLFLSVFFTVMRKSFQKLQPDVGGPKRLFALTMPITAILISPFALFQSFTVTYDQSIFSGSGFFGILAVALFSIVCEFYVEASGNQIQSSLVAVAAMGVSFVVSAFLEWKLGGNISFITFFGFALVAYGLSQIFSKDGKDSKDLPLYGTSDLKYTFGHFVKSAFRQILERRESRRIFAYLCINLGFMFVEMLYGFLTNSLGLISDACHMLFDCTALVIGLSASVISTWEPNKVYSYGYARVEVLSGFINGVFLIFIALLVLFESAERLWKPQEINTDKLLLVSVLGLCVNLVGVYAFHDLHSHGDGGGSAGDDHHGHSHSEKHSHSHGHGDHSHEGHDDHSHEGHEDHGHSHGNHGHSHGKEGNANLYGVYIHIIVDTLGSVAVIVSSILIQAFGWTIADPICSFCLSIMIVVGAMPLIYGSATTLLQCVPEDLESKLAKAYKQVKGLDGVIGYSQAHFWRHSGRIVVGSIHVQINGEVPQQKILHQIKKIFKRKGIKDLTVEISI